MKALHSVSTTSQKTIGLVHPYGLESEKWMAEYRKWYESLLDDYIRRNPLYGIRHSRCPNCGRAD